MDGRGEIVEPSGRAELAPVSITSPERPDDEPLGWLPQSYQQKGLRHRPLVGAR
jgi:hypothetical protein